MGAMTMQKMIFNNSYRFYEPLVEYLTHVSSDFIIQDPGFKEPRSFIMMGGNRHVINNSLGFYSADIIGPVLHNQIPKEIRLEVLPYQDLFGIMPITNFHLSRQILQVMFLRYYEHCNGQVLAKYGNRHYSGWPAVWNFARIVRNACAHDGIKFSQSTMKPVSWRNLAYSPSDNGRKIFHMDLWDVEIIHLMAEMEASL
jgi:hypothetical protein